jgi:hypothetical protein
MVVIEEIGGSSADVICTFLSLQILHSWIESFTQRARRIWLTDRQLSAIGLDLRDDLGDWIRHRLKKGVEEQGKKANQLLSMLNISFDELHHQWNLQKAARHQETATLLWLSLDALAVLEHPKASWDVLRGLRMSQDS